MTQTDAAVVRRQIVVEAPIDRAFTVFTERFGDFKPPGRDRAENTSEVEVRFAAETAQRTRVELEHRNLDRHGPGWESVGEGVEGDAGWPLYLVRYAELVTDGS